MVQSICTKFGNSDQMHQGLSKCNCVEFSADFHLSVQNV